jgi:hypothetical protein
VPGLRVTVDERPPEPSPLRTDIAGLLGRTRRGPVLQPVRVAGWPAYQRVFGGLVQSASTTYAARGYFDNGGEIAHVVRVAGPGAAPAAADWRIGTLDASGRWAAGAPADATFTATRFRVEATSPGEWANGCRVDVHYLAAGVAGRPEVEVRVTCPGEPVERLGRVAPDSLESLPSALVRFVRFAPDEPVPPSAVTPSGPRTARWTLWLAHGIDDPPTRIEYLAAVARLEDVPEAALLAAPDLHDDLNAGSDVDDVLLALVAASADANDRLVLIDVPRDREGARAALGWIDALRDPYEPLRRRTAAAYHPWLRVRDPLGGTARPLRDVPSSGHVAGVISRLDRERGAYYSPANAWVYEAVDVTSSFAPTEQEALNDGGINLLRCNAGGGLVVWGARTLDLDAYGRYVAHRRLVHRLVRAMRAVAEPLVFEPNGPELWLTLTRSLTSVLLKAYEAGALKGARPDEAFVVQCDERNNPLEEVEAGCTHCDVALAPAVPMEFIHIRLSLGANGLFEVVEA